VRTALKKWRVGIFEVRGWRKAGRVGEGDEGGFLRMDGRVGMVCEGCLGDWVIG
jgi:hypothetical protein